MAGRRGHVHVLCGAGYEGLVLGILCAVHGRPHPPYQCWVHRSIVSLLCGHRLFPEALSLTWITSPGSVLFAARQACLQPLCPFQSPFLPILSCCCFNTLVFSVSLKSHMNIMGYQHISEQHRKEHEELREPTPNKAERKRPEQFQ